MQKSNIVLSVTAFCTPFFSGILVLLALVLILLGLFVAGVDLDRLRPGQELSVPELHVDKVMMRRGQGIDHLAKARGVPTQVQYPEALPSTQPANTQHPHTNHFKPHHPTFPGVCVTLIVLANDCSNNVRELFAQPVLMVVRFVFSETVRQLFT